jgi:uncharacterized protein YdiU (UPF0061 family)
MGLDLRIDRNEKLLADLLGLLDKHRCDYHLALQYLGEDEAKFVELIGEGSEQWFAEYQNACSDQNLADSERRELMAQHNPKVILRNHHAQRVIAHCELGDASLLIDYFNALQNPFAEPNNPLWAMPPEEGDKGTPLSCSS